MRHTAELLGISFLVLARAADQFGPIARASFSGYVSCVRLNERVDYTLHGHRRPGVACKAALPHRDNMLPDDFSVRTIAGEREGYNIKLAWASEAPKR